MASDFSKLQRETLCTRFEEIRPKLPQDLSELIRKNIDSIESQKNALSSPAACVNLLQHLSDLNDALADCRVFTEQSSDLSGFNRFHINNFVIGMKKRLDAMKNELGQWMAQDRNGSAPCKTEFPTGRHTSFELNASRVLDFGDKEKEIEVLLAEEGYKAIAVYGMKDSGKTALLRKLLCSPPVCEKFSPIIWLCSSDIESEKDEDADSMILKHILSELGCDVDKWTTINPCNTLLLQNLKKLLMSKKYLIVFDGMKQRSDFYCNLGADISNTFGNRLSDGLPRDGGGKIIITSRRKEVAKSMVGEENLIHLIPMKDRAIAGMEFLQSNASFVDWSDEQEKVIGSLLSDKNYKAIGVYGMIGSGKTALVQKVLKNPSVHNVFSSIIWVCLSDINSEDDEDIDIKIVKYMLCELGTDVDRMVSVDSANTKLLQILKEQLMSKRYLIVFDDVWEKRDFYANLGDSSPAADTIGIRLSDALPRDGGKIIVTSRLKEVAEHMVGKKDMIHVKPLKDESCRRILESGTGFLHYATVIESFLSDGGFLSTGIYGPSEIANTALVHKALSSASVSEQFKQKVWIFESHISSTDEEGIRSEILKYMLKGLKYGDDKLIGARNHSELLRILKDSLSSEKYLVVMAGLGSHNNYLLPHWIWLFNALRQNGNSTVVGTSRIKEVAQELVGEKNLIHVRLPELAPNEEKEVTTHRPYITDEIVKMCHGLPLAATTLAKIIREMSILSNPEKDDLKLECIMNPVQTSDPNEGDPNLSKKANTNEASLGNFDVRMFDPFHHIENLISQPEKSNSVYHSGHSDDKVPKVAKAHRHLSKLVEKILEDPVMKNIQVSYDKLGRLDQFDWLHGLRRNVCLLSLSVFPENEVIKKRPLIYWWIGEGLIEKEEDGERLFEELLRVDLIIPDGNGKCPVVNKCKIHPWIRYMLISLARSTQLFDFDFKGMPLFGIAKSRRAFLVFNAWSSSVGNTSHWSENLRTIFNVNETYLDFDYDWLSSIKRLVVLQLGRWQALPEHHIEILSEAFLKALRTQKHLKFLSLRGISRISILPPSIVELVSLEILDLKACHNLEVLPHDIDSFKKLTHLDVSECYLLESMPKKLENLTSLEVLKGFLIGSSKKNPCRLGKLKSCKELRRLSIHIGSEARIQNGEFDDLKNFASLKRLKVSWGVVTDEQKKQVVEQSFTFPPSLEKLVLEGIPQEGVPEWLKPSTLNNLKKLYIMGGKLNSLDHSEDDKWGVEILRLMYLSSLEIGVPKLRVMFPSLKYAQKMRVGRNLQWSEGDKDEWSEESGSTVTTRNFTSEVPESGNLIGEIARSVSFIKVSAEKRKEKETGVCTSETPKGARRGNLKY